MIITNKYNAPTPFVSVVNKDYEYKDKRYSVTSILNEPRNVLLQRRHNNEITQDVSDMIWLIFGTAVHKILEEGQAEEYQSKEQKLTMETSNGYTLSGQYDLYDKKENCVVDYKTASVNKVLFNDWDDYKKQCLYYCCLLNKNGLKCQKAKLWIVLKDHSKSKYKLSVLKNEYYPETPLYCVEFNFTQKEIENGYKEIDEWFINIEKLEKLSDDELPICSNDFRSFKGKEIYAIKKSGNKRSLKNCDSAEEAYKYIEENNITGAEIEIRHAEPKRCMDYCSCSEFCKYKNEEIK